MRRKKYKTIVINPTKKKITFYQFFMIGIALLLLIGGGSYALLRVTVFSNQTQRNARALDTNKAPFVKLAGEKNMVVSMGSVFDDPGVSYVLTDAGFINIYDVDISYQYMNNGKAIDTNFVDTTRQGVYYIYYQVRDKKDNVGVAVRRVEVIPPTKSVHF